MMPAVSGDRPGGAGFVPDTPWGAFVRGLRVRGANPKHPRPVPYPARPRIPGWIAVLGLVVCGCSTVIGERQIVRGSHAVLDDDDDRHYRRSVSQVSRTMVVEPPVPPAPGLEPGPKTIRDRTADIPWDVTLSEVVHFALRNNPVIRQNAQFLAPNNPILTNPDQVASLYDPGLRQSGVLFGNRGTEAALSDFMPQFTSSLIFGRNLEVQNNFFTGGGTPPGNTRIEDTGQFESRIDQPLMSGGTFSLIHNWDYLQSNQLGLLFPSAYSGSLGAEFRQPLLAGAGADYTSVAGPIGTRNSVLSGVAQGIRIAQVNERIAAVDLELAIRNLAFEAGELYWQLYAAEREHEAYLEVQRAAYEVWQQVAANEAALGGAVVAQAEQTQLESRAQAENAFAVVLEAETRLRRLMGLPVADGRRLRAGSPPITEEPAEHWSLLVGEAFTQRPELHRQRLSIQSLDWQLRAARSLTKPRIDFVGGYQLNGFGDRLIDDRTADGITDEGYASAYSSLLRAKQPAWNLGVQFSMPIGFRAEFSQVRNLELQLAKARTALVAQEDEIRYELSASLQSLGRWYTLLDTGRVRKRAVQRQVEALETEYRVGRAERSTIDLLLRARTALADAQATYHRHVANYNVALWDLEYRRGRILMTHQLTFEPLSPRELPPPERTPPP